MVVSLSLVDLPEEKDLDNCGNFALPENPVVANSLLGRV